MVYGSISNYPEYNNFGSWVLSGIFTVLILILSLRYNNGTVDGTLFGLLLFVLVCSLVSMFVKILKNTNNIKKEKQSNIVNNIIEAEKTASDFEEPAKSDKNKSENKKIIKKVRFDAPLKEYEIIDNYQKDFFTFRNTLYQNSSNDFDYADIMNQEREMMDSKKPMKGKLWDLYDDLTKPDYSKIPVRYDNNLNNASNYYPVSYKGPTVRLT